MAQSCIEYDDYYPESAPFLGIVDTNFAYDVAVSGTNAFVADHGSGLRVVSFADPASPVIIGEANTPGYAWGVDIVGEYAYVADVGGGLQVINITTPTAPYIVGQYDTPGDAFRVAVQEGVAYVADGAGDLQIIDVSSPANPALLSAMAIEGDAYRVVVKDDLAYVGSIDPAFLHILSISDPSAPLWLSSVFYYATWSAGLAAGI